MLLSRADRRRSVRQAASPVVVRIKPNEYSPSPRHVNLTVYRRAPSSLRGVIPEIDIWRAAYLMHRWYGDTAQVESARRANELAAAGDIAGVAVWLRIIDTVGQIASTTPPGPVQVAFSNSPRNSRKRPAGMLRFLAIYFQQIDVLSRPKDNALPGLYIGRYSPQTQRHADRIDAERGPEGELADPMLFRMAGRAQRNGIAIGWLDPDTAVGSGTHMRGLRRRCSAAGHTGKLTDKSQVLPSPMQVRLGLAARYGLGDA
jgi:hypothetical protein